MSVATMFDNCSNAYEIRDFFCGKKYVNGINSCQHIPLRGIILKSLHARLLSRDQIFI